MLQLLGPGLRLGWVSGPAALLAKLELYISAASVGPASISQVMVHSMLDHWGRDGFEAFLQHVQRHYASRAQAALAAARRHLSGVASVAPTSSGMFLWFKLTERADADAVNEAALLQQVVVVPGRFFRAAIDPPGQPHAPCPYFRVTFAMLELDRIDEGFRRLRAAIHAAMPDTTTSAGV